MQNLDLTKKKNQFALPYPPLNYGKHQRNINVEENNLPLVQQNTNLITKGLWGVVDDDGAREVASKDAQVLDVVAVDADTVLPEQTVPARKTHAGPMTDWRSVLLKSYSTPHKKSPKIFTSVTCFFIVQRQSSMQVTP